MEDTRLKYDSIRDTMVIEEECPECGSYPVSVFFTCHTYDQGGTWVACIPCDSAGDIFCYNEICSWHYTWGLNPRNPRAKANEESRPEWLVGNWPY